MGFLRVSEPGSCRFAGPLAGFWGIVLALTGCTVAVGTGVGAAMLGGAALTAGCYDAIDVTVWDGVTGLKACDARVVARSTDGAEAAFASCFHAELPVGTWTVSAARAGYQPVSTELVVRKGSGCEPAVQSLEVSMMPVGVAPAAAVPIRPPRPGEQPLAPGSLPAPASIGVEQAAPAPAPAQSSAAPVSSATAPGAAAPLTPTPPAPPASGASTVPPSVGAFPVAPPSASPAPPSRPSGGAPAR